MTGALIQLSAYGAQDIYLTSDPQMSFFTYVYRRHTNFSIEPIILKFDKTPKFGFKNTVTLGKNADLIYNMHLQVDIPRICPCKPVIGEQAEAIFRRILSTLPDEQPTQEGDFYGSVSVPFGLEVIKGNTGFTSVFEGGNEAYLLLPANPNIEIDANLLEEYNGRVGVGKGVVTVPRETSIFEGVNDFLEEVEIALVLDQNNIPIGAGGGNGYRINEIYKLISIDKIFNIINGVEEYDEVFFSSTTAYVIIKTITMGLSVAAFEIDILNGGKNYMCPPVVTSIPPELCFINKLDEIKIDNTGLFVQSIHVTTSKVEIDLVPTLNNRQLSNIDINFKGIKSEQIDLFRNLLLSACNVLEETPIIEITGGFLINSFNWSRSLGHTLIKYVELEIGGQKIDKLYGDWLNIWKELTIKNSKEDGYDKMIGNVEQVYGVNISDSGTFIRERRLYVPLPFWFCRKPNLSLPVIATDFHEVKLNIEFRDAEECFKIGPDYCAIIRFLPPFIITAGTQLVSVTEDLIESEIILNIDITEKDKFVNITITEIIDEDNDGVLIIDEIYISNFSFILNDDVIIKLGSNFTLLDQVDTGNTIITTMIIDFIYQGKEQPETFNCQIGSEIIGDNGTIAYTQITDINQDSIQLFFEYLDKGIDDTLQYHENDLITICDSIFRIEEEPVLIQHILYKKPELVDAVLSVDYVTLSTEERRKFATQKHELLIEQLQYTGQEVICNNTTKLKLNFINACKEIQWVIQLQENTQRNNWDNYTDSVGNNGVGPLVNATILFNGLKRASTRESKYYQTVQPYQCHTRIPKQGIYTYSFSLYPEEYQPSGTMNFSRLQQSTFDLKFDEYFFNKIKPPFLRIYTLSYNVLVIENGISNLLFKYTN